MARIELTDEMLELVEAIADAELAALLGPSAQRMRRAASKALTEDTPPAWAGPIARPS